MRDDVEHLGDVRIATDPRESDQAPVGRMGGDVVATDTQHLEGLSRRPPPRAVPPDDPVEIVQLGRINGAVFGEGDQAGRSSIARDAVSSRTWNDMFIDFRRGRRMLEASTCRHVVFRPLNAAVSGARSASARLRVMRVA
jgi:hypothetical protein